MVHRRPGRRLLALATHRVRARRGFAAGLLFGLAFMFPHLAWSGTYVGLLPWSALTVVCALFYAVLGAFLPRLQRARWRLAPLAVATGWVALEAARARFPSRASRGVGSPSPRPTPRRWGWPRSADPRW